MRRRPVAESWRRTATARSSDGAAATAVIEGPSRDDALREVPHARAVRADPSDRTSGGARLRAWLTPPRVLLLVALLAIAVVAFVLRFIVETRHGGHLGIGAYDDGVYYASAAQLLHGNLPYRDYVLVQPPGMTVALVPFALLARLIGDPAAIYWMRIAFEVIGAANAVLVAVNLRRFGWAATLTGGLLYAVFFPAVYDERTVLLEPLGTTGTLVAVLLLARIRDGRLGPRWYLGCGIALGIGVDVKIWYIVPLLVVVAFAAGGRLRVLLGAVVAVVVCYLPFFLAAPAQSFRQIVLDQLGRSGSRAIAKRFASLLGVDGSGHFSTLPGVTSKDAVVLAAPSYFEHYAALVSAPLTLVVGVAAGRLVGWVRPRPAKIVVVALLLVAIVALNARRDSERADRPVPVAALQAAAAKIPGCIMSDEPDLLAIMGVLTRDLDHGCPIQPDMSGISFDPAGQVPGDPNRPRTKNPVYQNAVLRYLRSGDAFIAVRSGAALSDGTKAELSRNRVLFQQGEWVIRAGGQPG